MPSDLGTAPEAERQINGELIRSLSSVALLCPSGDGLPEFLDDARGWIEDYFQYVDTRLVHPARAPDLVYRREVNLIFEDLPARSSEIAALGGSLRRIGAGLSVSLPLSVLSAREEMANRVFDLPSVSGIGLQAKSDGISDEDQALVRGICARFGHKKIALIGTAFLTAHDILLSSRECSSADLVVYPERGYTGDPASLDRSPCSLRMKLFVDPSGDCYPCLGLLGLSEWCLGSIQDDAADMLQAFFTKRTPVARWFEEGPDRLADPDTDEESLRFGLPYVCVLHRRHLESRPGS